MPTLLLLVKNKDRADYLRHLDEAHLQDLEIVSEPGPTVELVFGDTSLIREVLPQLPGLIWAQTTWAGVEPLLDPALRRDYILTNARGVFGELMSEYVFGYLLLFERKILQRLEAQKQSRWEQSLTGSLRGKRIGLLGVGSIGAHLAGTARHFGMQVRGYTRQSESCPQVGHYFHGDDLQAFANGLDVLVSVLPNTAETRQIVDANLLSGLADQAVFINAGRGSAVDEGALCAALEQGRLACAVLDVFTQEPLPPEHPLWHTKNVYISSHTAAPSFPADISRLFIENYQRYLQNLPLLYQVNFELGY